ncbi:uncharacterized protein LOC143293763 [Babylonia areolata]|uniref:uncharacterized protein LOC143293763 n=1 Tax=Babylonia areolata TaxID=304850 RepID=UPI003FD35A2E
MSNCEDSQSHFDSEQPSVSHRPKNVPLRLWEKFQALEKRTNEATKRSTEKRIKHLQKTALENVARALHHPDDKEIVSMPPEIDSKAKGDAAASSSSPSSSSHTTVSRKRRAEDDPADNGSKDHSDRTCAEAPSEEVEKEWQKVRGLLGVNEHLAGVSHGALGPKTVLEMRIDDAITSGDYRRAEELSDHMASREFGEKVAKAIDAKNFLQHKQEEEETAKAKRKKKLHWGFEAKHRWETKSNM